jgi:hypothetical protein
MTTRKRGPEMSVWTIPMYLAAGELLGAAVLPAVLVTGLAGVAGVVAIGSALVAYGTRRTRRTPRREVPESAHR